MREIFLIELKADLQIWVICLSNDKVESYITPMFLAIPEGITEVLATFTASINGAGRRLA